MRLVTIMALLLVPFMITSEAFASELIARKAANVKLEVSRDGNSALLSYTTAGRRWFVRASGAINALTPTQSRKQVSFRIRRSTTRPPFAGTCTRTHPAVPELDAACAAGRTSWAVQSWQRALPNFGVAPSALRAQQELRLSHWSGAPAVLTLKADWSFAGKWQHVYGNLLYRGKPVYGFGTSRLGVPTDTFGRIVYLDTRDSAYGSGWHRENSFVTHNPSGFFCYDLSPHRDKLTGQGSAYRALVVGPGVTPDVGAYVANPGPFEAQLDLAANAEQARLAPDDRLCRPS
jgi:hypothetical protein